MATKRAAEGEYVLTVLSRLVKTLVRSCRLRVDIEAAQAQWRRR